jgi:hypothetical protein
VGTGISVGLEAFDGVVNIGNTVQVVLAPSGEE